PPAAATWQLPIGQPPVTWQLRQHRSMTVNAAGHWSTAAVHGGDRRSTPSVKDGQGRRSTTINAAGHRSTPADHGGDRRSTTVTDGEPPLTAAGPPFTTTGPPVNGGWWAGQRSALGRSGSGLGRVRVRSGSEVFRMPILSSLITTDIQGASYYQEYLAKVAKHERYLAGKTGSDPDSLASNPIKTAKKPKLTAPKADSRPQVSKPASTKQPKPKYAPTKTQGKKRKLTKEISDKPSKAKTSRPCLVSKRRKLVSSLRSVDESVAEDVPEKELRVDDEEADVKPKSGKYQPLLQVPGNGKEKVIEEQVAHDLLTLQTPKKKSSANRYIFKAHLHTYWIAGPDPGAQDKGQAGSNTDEQAKGQAGPDPGNAKESQPMPSPIVHAESDREHIDLDVADVSSQPPPEKMDEGFTATAYPKVQENLKLTFEDSDKPLDADNDKATIETEAASMVSVTARYRIGELEHIMANLIQVNKRLEQRMDSHGARMYTLEQLDIPHQLYEALEKSMNHDDSEELAKDLAEARKKRKKSRDSPKTPPGSPPHQPPPPPPPADIENAHIPKVNLRQDWWKPLEEERPATPEPAWSIPSSNVPVPMNNWASDLAELIPQDLECLAFEIIKVFHPNVIHLQYQMEECHKLLTDSVDDSILRHNVSKPLPLGGPPGQVTIQSDFFFNKDIEYLRYDSKCSRPAAVKTHMWILSVVRIEVFSMYGCDYMKKIVLHRVDLNEHVIAERDFKYLYLSDFEDLYLLNLQEDFQLGIESYQTQLNLTKPRWDAAIHKFSDGTLQQIDEAFDYRVKEFKINMMNPGLNTRFLTRKDVDRSKEFMFAIQKRLKTRRIFRNLESFVGG
nr:hypothetical protein [Tanacetum cinerariifolium]